MSSRDEIQPTNIQAMLSTFQKLVKEGNLEGVVGLYEPDAVLVGREGKVTSGTDAIRALYQRLLAIKAEFQLDPVTTIYAGDIGLNISDWQLTGTAPDGSPVSNSGRCHDIYRRQADGTWRIVIDNPYGYGTTESEV